MSFFPKQDAPAVKNKPHDGAATLPKRFIRHYRRVLSVNFDSPLSLRDEFIVMLVILVLSLLLFTLLYAVSCAGAPHTSSEESSSLPAAAEHSDKAETSADAASRAEASRNTDNSQTSQASATLPPYYKKMTTVTRLSDERYFGPLVLVNKELVCRYNGENVESIMETRSSSYAITDSTVSLDKTVVPYLNNMMDDFYEIYGYTPIMVACGYRSMSLQARLYNDELESGGQEAAEKWVAPAGYSEHQTGFALDLNLNVEGGSGIRYEGTDMYAWINEHCHDYGFIVRYPRGKEDITGYGYEPWHLRYVGRAHAAYMMQKELTLEEYLDIVHTHTPDKPLTIDDDGKQWYVYYAESTLSGNTEIPVPGDRPYEISGNNYDGFIITAPAK